MCKILLGTYHGKQEYAIEINNRYEILENMGPGYDNEKDK
jgi:hypothetical protein